MTYTSKYSVLTCRNALLVLICMSLAPEIVRFIRAVSMKLPFFEEITFHTDVILFTAVAIVSLPALVRRCKLSDFFFVLVVYFLFFLTYVLFPQNEEGLNFYILGFIFTVVPAYFIGRVIDIKQYKDIIYKVSVGVILLSAFYNLLFARAKYGSMEATDENMSAAYALLLNVLVVIWSTFEKPNLFKIVFSVFSAFLLLSFGSRGPSVCMVLFIASYLIVIKKWKKNILSIGLIALLAILIVSYIDIIFLYLYDWMSSLGMSTRIFDKLTDDAFFLSQGRDDLNELSLQKIRESNGSPYGIAAMSRWTDTYPHNLALQLWLEFGTIVGSIILLAFVFIIVFAFLKSKDDSERTFLLILIFPGFVHLFLSHTYLTVPQTFILIGYSVYLLHHNKTNRIQWKK